LNSNEIPIDVYPKEIGGTWTTSQSCFYQIPICWIGSAPETGDKSSVYPNVFEKKLKCGIQLSVSQDGMFLFEFAEYEPGKAVYIPEFKAADGKRLKSPEKRISADKLAFEHAMNRCIIMNCFMACLATALTYIEKRAQPIMQLTSPGNYITTEVNSYWKPSHAHYAYVSPIKNREHILSLETLNHAENLLNEVVTQGESCISVLHSIYQAHYLYSNLDFSNALLLSWMASERLFGELFKTRFRNNLGSKKRRKKLEDPRTFSAAVILEILLLEELISESLYTDLEIVRQARNNWVHKLMNVESHIASIALGNTYELFKLQYELQILISRGYSVSY